ncbi:MAG: hypothetical protein CVU44_10935 [Chloroflexi bacterium HGW-Chloroflexi-6]|nr:MAG: hypothetical protein CVU44_10935 [Chloroflexi bacterium HGW-Chloroflexi-6]
MMSFLPRWSLIRKHLPCLSRRPKSGKRLEKRKTRMPKIMLAEDDPTMLRLLKTLMELEGFDAVPLAMNENVLDAVHRESPDVLLLDVHLPQGNGLDFLRQIRADARFERLIVLMASGMSLKDECLAAGANAFLLKPFMPDMLIDSIRSMLASRPG